MSTGEKSDEDVEKYNKLLHWYKNDRRYFKNKEGDK